MTITEPTIIIADDLTGANDTALQFFKQGYSARIIIDFNQDFSLCENVDVWSVTTESRNTDKDTALHRVTKVSEKLKERVIGQDEAVESLARAIKRARVGLKEENRPIGSFMFLGPTGVGKTELSKALAEAVFGSEVAMIRIDMSE